MDLATLLEPLLAAGELRVIGSTTFEVFKPTDQILFGALEHPRDRSGGQPPDVAYRHET